MGLAGLVRARRPPAVPVGLAPETRGTRATSPSGRELSIVIFDSTVPIGTGEGVYMDAVAEQLGDAEAAIEVFSRRSLAPGGSSWTIADVKLTG